MEETSPRKVVPVNAVVHNKSHLASFQTLGISATARYITMLPRSLTSVRHASNIPTFHL